MKRLSALFVLLLLCADLSAAMFGGEPYEVFDQGGISYLVFGNSLIDDQETLFSETANRQGDTCLLESSSAVDGGMLPPDALVTKAYLIWMGAVDPEKMLLPTDNTVHLKFAREDGYTYEEDIIAGDTPKTINDTSDLFGFESLKYTANITTGCTETDPGQPGTAELAYFTYRTDITPFFNKLREDNYAATPPVMDGVALQGTYTVSGLDCTDHDYFKCRTLMVSNWSLLLIYRSDEIGGKKLFLYPGLARLQGESYTTIFESLDLPEAPQMRFTMVTAEGDTGLFRPELPPEMLYLQGQNGFENYPLVDNCSSNTTDPVEIWDSYSSTTEWTSEGRCMSRAENPTFSYDIDTFYVDAGEDPRVYGQFMKEEDSLGLVFSLNQDDILTNFFMLAVNTKEPCFDIPDKDELVNCLCYPEEREVYCGGEPQYIQIRLENWGTGKTDSVYVQVEYDSWVFDYVANTTEIATEFDQNGNGTNWQKILDGPEGKLPLLEPNLIANTLYSFQTDPEDALSYLIRFRLLPKTGLQINSVGEIRAAISDDQGPYYVNKNFPMRLYPGKCEKTCTLEELKKLCGGPSPDDPDIFNPNPDDDAIAGSDDELTDELSDETPDAAVDQTPEDDPEATHPMKDQEPGCSLTVM
jgi:hypothetical protein